MRKAERTVRWRNRYDARGLITAVDGFEHGTTEPVQENAEPDQPIDMGWIDEQANVKLKQKRAPSRDDPETAEESEEALRVSGVEHGPHAKLTLSAEPKTEPPYQPICSSGSDTAITPSGDSIGDDEESHGQGSTQEGQGGRMGGG